MDGKRCIVTGATSGIGTEIARGLVERGARVGIIARNPAKAKATVEELGGGIEVFRADLGELAEVRRVAAELRDRWGPIDVLVNNAGINSTKAGTTAEGFDAMVATNYLGPFLLTNLVTDLLEASGDARVVNIASEAHRISDRLDAERFEVPSTALAGNRFYGRTKLALILFTQELAARLDGRGVTANSCCPGMVATNLVGSASPVTRASALLARTPLVRRPDEGARLPLRLATDRSFAGVTGQFFSSTPAGRLPVVASRRDGDLQARLWERTAALVGIDG
jgi:retinol dehydrogenase 12